MQEKNRYSIRHYRFLWSGPVRARDKPAGHAT